MEIVKKGKYDYENLVYIYEKKNIKCRNMWTMRNGMQHIS